MRIRVRMNTAASKTIKAATAGIMSLTEVPDSSAMHPIILFKLKHGTNSEKDKQIG